MVAIQLQFCSPALPPLITPPRCTAPDGIDYSLESTCTCNAIAFLAVFDLSSAVQSPARGRGDKSSLFYTEF